MGNYKNSKNNKQLKTEKTRERVFKAIVSSPEQDLFTLRSRLVKNHVVDSGNKFDAAIEELKQSRRIIVSGGKNQTVRVNEAEIKQGIYFFGGSRSYVKFDGDEREYGIDRKFAANAHTGKRVRVAFSYVEGKKLPFIVPETTHSYDRVEEIIKANAPKQSPYIPQAENPNLVYGRVMKTSHDNLTFIPNDKQRFKGEIVILNDKKTWAKFQDKICTLELSVDSTDSNPTGVITAIIGDAGNPIAEYDAIAESHGANMSWSDPAVLAEIAKIPTSVDLTKFNLTDETGIVTINNNAPEAIVDLRHLPFTTTDPATCKDMDDAIYSTFDENGNLVVYTAVADVSRYVNLDSEIGRRYIKASFTTYAPNKAYNILPPELSTGICSLNPNVDRLALVVKTVINPKTGDPIKSTYMEAVIESKEKFSYEQAQEITDTNPEITKEILREKGKTNTPLTREEQVVQNKIAADILWRGFKSRNQIEFKDNNEYDTIFNEDYSDIVDLRKQENCAYHKVIEAFMVTANEATAKFALEHDISNIYRIHDEPSEGKIDQAYEFFGYLNIPFDGDLSVNGIKKIVNAVSGTNKEKVVNNFLIRMQSKAKYSISRDPKQAEFVSDRKKQRSNIKTMHRQEKNQALMELIESLKKEDYVISHFGLQSKHYSHTTSPIRRTPDYVTHFQLLAYLSGRQMLAAEHVRDIAMWANQMQDQNDMAEREFMELNSAIYCENHINEVMRGRICGFKSLTEGKELSLENLFVVVENEDKGVKVLVPAIEVLGSKISSAKNICISKFGSAIVNKASNRALITLCDEVEFKIAEANRITRTAYASTNLLRDFKKVSIFEELDAIREQAKSMVHKQEHQRDGGYDRQAEETRAEETRRRSRKNKRHLLSKGVAEEVEDDEVHSFSKNSNIQVKSKREEYRRRAAMEEFAHHTSSKPYPMYDLEEDDEGYEEETIERVDETSTTTVTTPTTPTPVTPTNPTVPATSTATTVPTTQTPSTEESPTSNPNDDDVPTGD